MKNKIIISFLILLFISTSAFADYQPLYKPSMWWATKQLVVKDRIMYYAITTLNEKELLVVYNKEDDVTHIMIRNSGYEILNNEVVKIKIDDNKKYYSSILHDIGNDCHVFTISEDMILEMYKGEWLHIETPCKDSIKKESWYLIGFKKAYTTKWYGK